MLFLVAGACLALAAGGWWLQRVAFDTEASAEIADVVLRQEAIRQQVVTIVASSAAGQLGVPEADLRAVVDEYVQADDAAIHEVLSQVVADSHARLIGERSEPVQITGAQLVPIVRDQHAADLPPITIPVQQITVLNVIRHALVWFVPLMAGAGALALLLGLVAHPRPSDAVFGIGLFLLFSAAAIVLLGWIVPMYAIPEADQGTWIALIPAVAEHNLPYVFAAAIVLVAVALAVMVAATTLGRRRSWRTPVNLSRYNEQRRWSR